MLPPLTLPAQKDLYAGLPLITNFLPKDFHWHPQNRVILEDDRGWIYGGNTLGLLEYDGVDWRKIPISDGVGIVRSLSKNQKGTVFVGSYRDLGYLATDKLGQTRFRSLLIYIPAEHRDFFDVWHTHRIGEDVFFMTRERLFRLRPSCRLLRGT